MLYQGEHNMIVLVIVMHAAAITLALMARYARING
jgi:hypothetical protein